MFLTATHFGVVGTGQAMESTVQWCKLGVAKPWVSKVWPQSLKKKEKLF